jgi:hypothetical protein
MTLSEWLRRLNLSYLSKFFADLKITQLTDLKSFGEEKPFEEAGIKFESKLHMHRIVTMINGKDKVTL